MDSIWLANGLSSGFKSFFKSEEGKPEMKGLKKAVKTVWNLLNKRKLSGATASGPMKSSINCIRECENTGFTFWDIWFRLREQRGGINNWTDVESQLSFFLNPQAESMKGERSPIDAVERVLDRWHVNDRVEESLLPPNLKKDRRYGEGEILSDVLVILFEYQLTEHSKEYLYDFLFQQLVEFENRFKKYLAQEVIEHKDYEEKCKSLIKKIKGGERFNLLSFNYTTPDVGMEHRVNIHGDLDGDIIMGIDSENISAQSQLSLFKFTKTYRVMTQSAQRQDIVLSKDIKTISFFGHSLAAADYSYFQSIFDYFDIYANPVTLIFYYKVYLEKDSKGESIGMEASRVRQSNDQFKAVSKLLDTYGATFGDREGNNLLHKLLLEGRLLVKEVVD